MSEVMKAKRLKSWFWKVMCGCFTLRSVCGPEYQFVKKKIQNLFFKLNSSIYLRLLVYA